MGTPRLLGPLISPPVPNYSQDAVPALHGCEEDMMVIGNAYEDRDLFAALAS